MFVEVTAQWKATPMASCLERTLPPMHLKASAAGDVEMKEHRAGLSPSPQYPPPSSSSTPSPVPP